MINNFRRYFPFLFIPVATAIAMLLAGGCSSTTTVGTNDGQSTVTMQTSLATSDVNQPMVVKGDVPNDLIFSSLVVTDVEVFVKDIKLHSDVDSLGKDDHDGTIKTGPFVLVFDSSGSHVVTSAVIPPGTYDHIKFEIHKPGKNDAADASILTQFPEFDNGNGSDNYTVVIHGYTMSNGVRTDFVSRSRKTYNLTLNFEDNDFNDKNNIVLGANAASTLAFEFDPRIMFHLSGTILPGGLIDPRDTKHQDDIDSDGHLGLAIRIVLK